MVTQRFWSSAIYLATSNSHASGIVGPRHDHMAIIHRQAADKQASNQASKQAFSLKPCGLRSPSSAAGYCGDPRGLQSGRLQTQRTPERSVPAAVCSRERGS